MEKEHDSKASCAFLSRAAQTLSLALREPDIIQILLEQAVSLSGASAALVQLLSAEGDELVLAGERGFGSGFLRSGPVPISESALDQRILTTGMVTVPDIGGEAVFRDSGEASGMGLRGLVAAPLTVRERVVGVFRVYVDEVEDLTSEDLALLKLLSDLGGLALERVRLHQSLYRIAQALTSSLELQPMLQRVLEAAVENMNLKGASIRLLSGRDRILHLAASCGLSARYLEKGAVDVDHSGLDQRVLEGQSVLLCDVENEAGLQYPEAARREGIRSVLAVPLKLKERTLGVMRAYGSKPLHYSQVDVEFLNSVADLVALAIENAELYGALRSKYEGLKMDLADWYQFLALG